MAARMHNVISCRNERARVHLAYMFLQWCMPCSTFILVYMDCL